MGIPRRSKSEPIKDPVQAAQDVKAHAAVIPAAQAPNVADFFQDSSPVNVQARWPHLRGTVAPAFRLLQPFKLRPQVAFYSERAASLFPVPPTGSIILFPTAAGKEVVVYFFCDIKPPARSSR